jgi:hypothetical protein
MPFLAGRGQAGRGMFGLGGIPAAVGAIALTAGDAIDTFSWSAPQNNGLAITKYGYQTSTNNGSSWNTEVEVLTTSAVLNTQYSASSFKIRVRAFNAAGWGEYSTISSSGTGVWTSGGTSLSNPTACPAPTCSACAAPDCSGGCGECAACGACDCGTSSITGSVGTRTATAGTRAAATLGTSSRTCYRWTRSGSTSSGYIYNQNSTDACSSTYSACTAGTCGECSAGSCSGCSASTCGCSACGTRTRVTTDVNINGTQYYTITHQDGTIYHDVNFDTCGDCVEEMYNITLCQGVYTVTNIGCQPFYSIKC